VALNVLVRGAVAIGDHELVGVELHVLVLLDVEVRHAGEQCRVLGARAVLLLRRAGQRRDEQECGKEKSSFQSHVDSLLVFEIRPAIRPSRCAMAILHGTRESVRASAARRALAGS